MWMEGNHSYKNSLWEAVVQADEAVPASMIEKLASTMVTIKNGEHINK